MGPEILALLPALTMNEVRKRPQYEWAESHFILQNDAGGDVTQYAHHFLLIKRSGERVVVSGACFSACTMVLSNPMACAMPSARFGFHSARRYNLQTLEVLENSDDGNKILWAHYP